TAAQLAEAPPPSDPEWLAKLAAGSTDLPAASKPDALTPQELKWLDDVAVLISDAERRAFRALPRSYQRAGFIEAFWKARDKNPKTPENETRSTFEARLDVARERWHSITVDQAKVYLVNGEAHAIAKPTCGDLLWPLEVWRYAYSDRSRRAFVLLFYAPMGFPPYRLWQPAEGYAVLLKQVPKGLQGRPLPRPGLGLSGDFQDFYRLLRDTCGDEGKALVNALLQIEVDDPILVTVVERPLQTDPEWLSSFRTFSTEVAGDAKPLTADLQVDFPGRHQSRTLVRGTLVVPPDNAAAGGGSNGGAGAARGFSLIGEVLRGAALHESFRYYFQLASPAADGSYPLVFERFLRPGDFQLVLKL